MFAETSCCSGKEVNIILHAVLERICVDLYLEIFVAKSVIQAREDGREDRLCLFVRL